jgi:probable phosphoglycerate mutase
VLPGPLPTGATKVVVVRHGETTWGADGRFAGREDVPLTGKGRRQASSVGDRIKPLRPSVVLTSPLQRCQLTAKAIGGASGAPVVINDDLLDGLLGEWTGLRPAEIESGWPEQFAVWRSDPDAAPPAGESFNAIRDRVTPLLDEVVRLYRGHTVVLVTHAAATKMILVAALDVPTDAAYRIRIDTASLSGFTIDEDGSTVVWAMNETGHLTG